MDISYILNQLGEDRENYFNAVSPPIIQTSNFAFPNVALMRKGLEKEREVPAYTRGMNPTVEILRKKLAALENAEDALIFSSGCAAISASVMANVAAGDHVVCVRSPYSWTNNLLKTLLPKFGVTTTFIDGTDPDNFTGAVKGNTKVFYLESPNSYTFELQDIAKVVAVARDKNITTIIDNSYATPLNQLPLNMGCDIVVHSASKYFGGHSDLVAGVICSTRARINNIFSQEYMTLGGIISPNDAWLMIRGLRTFQLRMERIAASTAKITEFLDSHPKIEKVFYPFLESSPQYELACRQMKQGTGLFTVKLNVKSIEEVEEFCNSLKRFLLACSWGGYESLVFPTCVFHNSTNITTISELPFDLVRFYIGLEEPEVLIEDLGQALDKLIINN
jgi:cystathionine beta-lyase/cystathionine gamma-synthase